MAEQPRGLTRKATWISPTITLKTVLKDPRALKALQDFATTVHAEEVRPLVVVVFTRRAEEEELTRDVDNKNVSFWVACEFFKVQHVSTPKTSARVRKRLSENLRNLKVAEEDPEHPEMFKTEPRHSVLMDKVLTPDKIAELDLSDHQKSMLRDAVRLFTTFLEDGAPHWACVDTKIVDEIREILKSGQAVDIGLFNKAQTQIYATMNTDLFPRFLKAIVANPEKYSSGERLELPDDLREALKTVASKHEMLSRDAALAAADASAAEDPLSVFTSPRITSRRMPTVEE